MKKLTALILFTLLLLLQVKPALAAEVDQSCITEGGSNYVSIVGNTLEQTFTPSKAYLTQVKLLVKGDGAGKLRLNLFHGSDWVADSSIINEPTGFGSVVMVFENLPVTPGDVYKIRAKVSDNTYALWNYKENCYANGKAYVGGVSQNYDFGFTTYGFDLVVEGNGDADPTNTPTPTTAPADGTTPTATPTGGATLTTTPTSSDSQDQSGTDDESQAEQDSTPSGEESGQAAQTTTPGATADGAGGLSLSLIIGISLGLFVILTLSGLAFYKFVYLKRKKKATPAPEKEKEGEKKSDVPKVPPTTEKVQTPTTEVSKEAKSPQPKEEPKNLLKLN